MSGVLANLAGEAAAFAPLMRSRWHARAFVLARYLPALRNAVFAFRHGKDRFWLRPKDGAGVLEILVDGEYAAALELLRAAPQAPVVVDAGANVGAFSLAVLALRPDAVLHALEPSPGTARLLRRNLGRRAMVHALALAGASGPTTFADGRLSTASGLAAYKSGRTRRLEGITLDGFLARAGLAHVDLLKMDIEGAEAEVLPACQRMNDIGALVVEVHVPTVDDGPLRRLLAKRFAEVRDMTGRRSSKPLLLALHPR